ncbi:Molecular chaperone OS=Singulisphaera acidiphila (strain ATCC BAA-1392 / DSM 18658 / VKM B-2454 / MOB10) GN=Sinac_2984 PE=3 SV=1: HSP70 [Gemmataceae bacterium]|nr:Molecular chaperone OS=Singulisphaera acidiphila (strain ATCC BAA-1392 / DSM 18658 / VKM B-2454 / MOB10) GN=Sinac_2984 PE=3 SV=1: HSP70 [Gemmataceae bacterium]VTT97426.1 Molecular chaperone OS=Singulisphaera acidiphila (strain ATCC BAA-1392 / DSM 18658 / VKM B-2454 / MOB10) GN=Sinac_2984 PE=3 SV=1: HSP70 [Gemmataceae bacterium]
MASRFVVGIDLGTTNSALAFVDTGAGKDPAVTPFAIPQVVGQGVVEERPLLPSFLYLPGEGEQPAGALKLPWDAKRDYCVGEFARAFGSQVPTRLVASGKSWLCHSGVDRKAAILPQKAPETGRKVSPVEASVRYMKHLAEAWNYAVAKDVEANRLEAQDIVLTVPASFDAAARDLTIEAARTAGFEHLTLLEEPQAAFYAWLDRCGDDWRKQVNVGDLVLVSDVGGGTTDFTLIEVGEEGGNLSLTRLAVGDHLLLGGDNMDLTLAYYVAQILAKNGTKLDGNQMTQLTYACRNAKEQLLADAKLATAPVTVLGKGRSLVGGTIKYDLSRADVEKVLVDGFFPDCPRDAEPSRAAAAGLQELGLPYVADAGITKHLAQFLQRQAEALASREAPAGGKKKKGGAEASALPAAVLFNGGVFKADPLRNRFLGVLGSWAKGAKTDPARELSGADLDLAVARGAAYYGLVKRGKGVRIRGGTARAYYIGVATNMPAVPGFAPPVKALCVAPFGMEEGTETDIPGYEVGVRTGTEAEFRFLGSTVRREDAAGTVVEDWDGQIDELSPVRTTLEAKGGTTGVVPVHLHTKVTPVGQLELWLMTRDAKQKWKLEFNVREGK